MQPLALDLLGMYPKTFHDLRQNFLPVYRISVKRSKVSAIQSNKESNYK